MNTASLDKSLNYFQEQIKFIHAVGSANAVLEEVKCDAYNSKMKIRDLGTVNSLGSGSYMINLWDASIVENVKTAILETLNLNPAVEGSTLKVNFPPTTQEKRSELTKVVSKFAEETLISIRNIRRDEINKIEKDFKEKLISEDQKNSLVDKIETVIKQYSQKVNDIKDKKNQDINTL
jgi:ribosome recycling factor